MKHLLLAMCLLFATPAMATEMDMYWLKGTIWTPVSASNPMPTTGSSCAIATTLSLGCIIPDGVTIVVNGSGVASAIGAASASITVGTTTIGGGTIGRILSHGASDLLAEVATIGSGNVVLATSPTIAGLTVTGSLTATGLVTNADLVNPATTVNGQTCTLGSTCTVTAVASSFAAGTTLITGGTAPCVLENSTSTTSACLSVGTSGAVLGLLNGALTFSGADIFSSTVKLTGISAGTQVSCLGLDSSNFVVLNAAACGSGGGSTLTFGTHLTGTSYNGSAPVTIGTDATNANTVSTIVARDGSGNFTAGTITASLTGHASLDAALSGATMSGLFTTVASASGGAGLNLPQGAAPTSPVNGDLWTTSSGIFVRIAGSTVGPLGTGGGSVSVTASTADIVVNPSPGTGTFTIGTTTPIISTSTSPYIFNGTGTSGTGSQVDNTYLILTSGAAMTLAQAGTTGFAAGVGWMVVPSVTTAITPTTSTIGGLSVLSVAPNQFASIGSDGTNYQVALGLPPSGTQNLVLATPNGSTGQPKLRALVAADLPATAVTPGSYTSTNLTVDAAGRITAAANGTASAASVTPGTTTVVGATAPCLLENSTSTTLACPGVGTGVITALGVNTGSAGAFVVNGGALGTPSSGVGTNLTGTAASLTAGTATVANGIKTATTTVVVSSATAPTSGQVLTATSGTAADWETPSGGSGGAGGSAFTYSDNGVTLTANTYYAPIGGGGTPQTTEAAVSIKAPSAATVSNLNVQLSADPGAGQTLTVTLRVAGAGSALTCVVTGGSGAICQDATHSVSVAQNALIDWQIVTTGTYIGTPTITIAASNGGVMTAFTPGTTLINGATAPCTIRNTTSTTSGCTAETGTGSVVLSASPALTGVPTAPTAAVATNTTQIATTAFVIANAGSGGGVTLNYIGGCTLANNGGTPNSIINVAACQVADSTNAEMIPTLAAFTKSTAGSFATGSGSNGMGIGLTIANSTWYHVMAIDCSTGGAHGDIYFDTSVTAANIPACATKFRRIGSFLTDGSAHILAFIMHGDEVAWVVQKLDVSAGSITATTPTNETLSVPPGVFVVARGTAFSNAAPSNLVISSPETSLTEASGNVQCTSSTTGCQFSVMTNTSKQVTVLSDSSISGFFMNTTGYRDFRGQ